MRCFRSSLIAAACGAALAGAAVAQTTSTTTSTTTTTTAPATAPTTANAAYLKRAEQRFGAFAGSSDNVDSLASGLRGGSEITLTGSGGSTSFTPPTRPMGYGNITRALDLAQRQLAAAGITDPTPQEIRVALMGGSISGPNGDVKFAGVLQLRSQGMGWGQIAHAINVPAGMGKPATTAATTGTTTSGLGAAGSRGGVVTAAGASPVVTGHGHGAGASAGVSAGVATNAAGASAAGAVGAGKGNGNAFGHANAGK